MIDFNEGKINIGEKNISAVSDYEDLKVFAEEGLIDKRESEGGRHYFYLKAMEDSMRLGVFIRLHQKPRKPRVTSIKRTRTDMYARC